MAYVYWGLAQEFSAEGSSVHQSALDNLAMVQKQMSYGDVAEAHEYIQDWLDEYNYYRFAVRTALSNGLPFSATQRSVWRYD